MIFVTGGAGEIGSVLVRQLVRRLSAVKRGLAAVRVMVLPGERAPDLGPEVELFEGDVTDPRCLGAALEGVTTVYHLAALLLSEDEGRIVEVNVGGTANLLAAARDAGVRHFIHISSASVTYQRSTPYSRSKRQGEKLVKAADCPELRTTVVRPTLVYDEGSGLEFQTFAAYLQRFPVSLLPGDGRALKRPVHVLDLVEGLAAILENPKTYGETYALSGGQSLSVEQLARTIMRRKGILRPIIFVPEWLLRPLSPIASILGRKGFFNHTLVGLSESADLDHGSALADFGYRPRSFEQGIGVS